MLPIDLFSLSSSLFFVWLTLGLLNIRRYDVRVQTPFGAKCRNPTGLASCAYPGLISEVSKSDVSCLYR